MGYVVSFQRRKYYKQLTSVGVPKAHVLMDIIFILLKIINWNVLKDEIICVIKVFHDSGYILRRCNASVITLVPKKQNPLTLNEF